MKDHSNLVILEKSDGVATLTLNRPQALNALSTALRSRLAEVFANLADDRETEVVILTGAGRAFTVGIDLKELGGEITPEAETTTTDLSEAMGSLTQPIIGAVNGYVITGGFELALMCDFLIASTEAQFADTHARVGVIPGWGLSQRLPRLIGINRAKELSLTGNYLNASTAYAWGLVNRVVEPDQLLPTCHQLAKDIITTDRQTRTEIRRIMDAGWQANLADGLDIETRACAAQEIEQENVAARRAAIQSRGRRQSGT